MDKFLSLSTETVVEPTQRSVLNHGRGPLLSCGGQQRRAHRRMGSEMGAILCQDVIKTEAELLELDLATSIIKHFNNGFYKNYSQYKLSK